MNAKPETIGKLLNLVCESLGKANVPRLDLPRVLMALGKLGTVALRHGFGAIGTEIKFWKGLDDQNFEWNLLHDADGQSEETLQAIINILQANLSQE